MFKHLITYITNRTLLLIATLLLLQFRMEAADVVVNAGNAADLIAKVNAARSPDVVYVPGGTYTLGNNTGNYAASALRPQNGVTIVGGYGTPGTPTVIIIPANRGYGHLFEVSDPGNPVTIQNITMQATITDWPQGITGGAAIGISGNNVNLVVDNCVIQNSSIGGQGGGIYAMNGASAKFTNTQITGNTGPNGGGGCYATSNAKVEFEGCSFSGNTTSGPGGGIYVGGGASAKVTNTQFSSNTSQRGGACYVDQATAEFGYSTILENTAINGGAGFYLRCPSTLTITSCTMVGNTNNEWGTGGIGAENNDFTNCTVQISNSVVSGNGSNQPGSDDTFGGDIPPGTGGGSDGGGIDIGGSIVGGDYVDGDSVITGVFDPDTDIVIGDSGTVEITIPDTIADILPPPDEDGNPGIGAGGGNQPRLRIAVTDTIICAGDSAYFTLTLRNYEGSAAYSLYQVEGAQETQIGTTINSSSGSVNFTIMPRATAIGLYKAKAVTGSDNQTYTSRERQLIILPATSGNIEHSKNTTDQ